MSGYQQGFTDGYLRSSHEVRMGVRARVRVGIRVRVRVRVRIRV